ncbi:PTS fructose transporter subunit IIA [Atlantibacter hermannii]|uniref:PTS fructose transporter subunit IIA n=1 Tax=Atlantibacter hermannii TaxID=565 RepID=UPI0019328970|nr:PTS fructose transporter subunit IIA [Atlantibacter hermannii]MBL7635488.1 PTS fructose transporter subunit IIA [Atlantibacter hermannii]MBL7673197.1 PTS fructose transporter subunit IIA [Atlantibacter hermannii]
MPLITPSDINLDIEGNSAYSVLKALAHHAYQQGHVSDQKRFLQTLLLREKIHSTGFGGGVAVPHGKNACVVRPFILFARSRTQRVGWKSMDDHPVNCWICLGVPEHADAAQVSLIGTLCRKIIHQEFTDQLKTGNEQEIVALLNATLQ